MIHLRLSRPLCCHGEQETSIRFFFKEHRLSDYDDLCQTATKYELPSFVSKAPPSESLSHPIPLPKDYIVSVKATISASLQNQFSTVSVKKLSIKNTFYEQVIVGRVPSINSALNIYFSLLGIKS